MIVTEFPQAADVMVCVRCYQVLIHIHIDKCPACGFNEFYSLLNILRGCDLSGIETVKKGLDLKNAN
jgi:hypothetical protein